MTAHHDRRAHADAVRRQNRINQAARWRRQAGAMLASIALGAIVVPSLLLGDEAKHQAVIYRMAQVKAWFAQGAVSDPTLTIDGNIVPTSVIVERDDYRDSAETMLAEAIGGAILGLAGWIAAVMYMREATDRRREHALQDRIIAGTMVTSEAQLAHMTNATGPTLHIGSVAMPANLETRHMAMIGTTGSGKTTALRQLLDCIEARGEPALVYDTSGEFIANYYQPERGDVILNPFDARCAFWSPFAEIGHPADADRIAHQLITETGQHDSDVWLDTSRILVANMIRALWRDGNGTLPALLDALQDRTKDDLKVWLAGSSSARTGAEELGLSGDVDRDQFRRLLDGEIAGQQLGTVRDGQLEHRPGWDVTLSAPKSVSIMADVAGDRRLIGAHQAAAKTAMAHVEKHMAATRVRDGGTVNREATGNLVIASFQHGTSRAQDPQLHTHNVVLNATKGEDGTWRSLEPRAIYQLQKQIGAIYRQELAVKVRELGYEIETGKDSMFEIKGVSGEVLAAFSTRSAQIDAALDERGTSRDGASAAEKQIAALDTREAKSAADHATLVKGWRETADGAGFGDGSRMGLVNEAKAIAARADHIPGVAKQGDNAATRAVAHAAEKLGERQSVFSASALQEEAGRFALGKVSYEQIGEAIADATRQGALIERTHVDRRGAEFSGFTTRANVETETKMLRSEAEGRGAMQPIASPLAAAKAVAHAATQAERTGFGWNDDQRAATAQLLTSADRITSLQGFAGTAKTTTVLATVAREAQAQGSKVTALAPTASAAMVLGEALGARGDTVARHLLSPERASVGTPGTWIVDEASLLSARDSAKLFAMAEKQNARVILVGDVKQLGSVEAGAAFAQLQGAGMATAKLAEIVRQTNAATKEAVQASIEGNAAKALAALDGGGGKIIENADRGTRFAAIAGDYAALDKAARAKTLVIEPSREGRDALTAKVRDALAKSGALSGPAITMQSLANKGLTRAEARLPDSYDKGDIVRFTRDYADKGVSRGAAYRVESVDLAKSAITLQSENGHAVDWRLRQWGAGHVQAFTPQALELKTGDSIRFTRNDREAGRINGARGEIVAIDMQARTATIQNPRGQTQTLNLDSARDQHIAHAYVETAFAAQGRTADHVLIHADSRATNLIDQKSFYVAISRAKESIAIYTNDRAKLVSAISERSGQVQTAMEQPGPSISKTFRSNDIGLGC